MSKFKTKQSILNFVILVFAIIVVLNFISDKMYFRLDLTSDKRYTLSKVTREILRSLDKPVTVKAYFSEELPPEIMKTRRDFKELLIEYNNVSKGMVDYEFLNPNQDDAIEQEALQAGISPVMINTREKDQAVQKKAYLGAIIQLGDESELIPFMKPGAAMEYSLSSSIKKLSVKDKPIVGFIQGHGEPGLDEMNQVNAALSILYKTEAVYMEDDTTYSEKLNKYSTLVIIGPTDSFPDNHLKQLDNFLGRGKNLLIAYNRVKGDFSTARGSVINTGLETWLRNKGINIEDNFITDINCGSVSVRQQSSFFTFTSNIRFPYLPLITNFEKHPITEGLELVVMQFASPIKFTGDSTIKFTPIAWTSEKTGTAPGHTFFDIQKRWTESDFPLSHLTVAAIIEGKISGDSLSKMAVISDADFAINGKGPNTQRLQEDNVNLMVNTIDWLADKTGLIELRTKSITSRPIKQVKETTKILLKYFNFLLPIILIIIYGIIRMQTNRNLRVKRMDPDYI